MDDSGGFHGPSGSDFPATGFHLVDLGIAAVIAVPLAIAAVGFVLGRWSATTRGRRPQHPSAPGDASRAQEKSRT